MAERALAALGHDELRAALGADVSLAYLIRHLISPFLLVIPIQSGSRIWTTRVLYVECEAGVKNPERLPALSWTTLDRAIPSTQPRTSDSRYTSAP